MRFVYTINKRGQLTIPQAIRKALGLRLDAPVLVNVVSLDSSKATLQLAPVTSLTNHNLST
jgi:bifunctional DNA-binding transcriptional regulator/antitoxin component of YhaV-PrlF toxin-antitoxin module